MSPGCKCCGVQATITGGVVSSCVGPGGTNARMVNASLTVRDTGLTTTYGTVYTDSTGNFLGNVTIPSSPLSVKITAAIDPTNVDAPRYDTSTGTFTLTGGSTTSTGTFFLPAKTGYHCLTAFPYPIANTLHLTDSMNGSYNLVWASTDSWQATANINYPGCASPSCVALNNVPCSYALFSTAGPPQTIRINFNYRKYPLNTCPDLTNPAFFSVQSVVTPTQHPFNISQSIPSGNPWYCGGSYTWTVTE